MIVGHCTASQAFLTIAEMEMRLFRDAGNAPMEFGISIQVSQHTLLGKVWADEKDCLYGIEKAVDAEVLDMTTFDPDTYRFFETVE